MVALPGFQTFPRKADKRSPFAHDFGGKSCPDDLHLAGQTQGDAGRRRQLRSEKSEGFFQEGKRHWTSGPPQRRRQRQKRTRDRGTYQSNPKIFPGKQPPKNSGHVSRRLPPWTLGHRLHPLPATHSVGVELRSRNGRASIHHDRRRSTRTRSASRTDSGD